MNSSKIKNLVKEGNSCLFFLFVLFNFFVFLSSMGFIGCAIFLFVETKQTNAFNMGFLIIGLLLFGFSLLAFKMRKSTFLLFVYVWLLFIFFTFQLIITIVMITKREKLIEIAETYLSDDEKTDEYIKQFE